MLTIKAQLLLYWVHATLYMYIICCCVGFKAVQIILKRNEVIVHTCGQDRMQRAGGDHMTVIWHKYMHNTNTRCCKVTILRFMHCNVWHDKNLCGTNFCDWHFTRIIRINKTRAEKCHFMVISQGTTYNYISVALQYTVEPCLMDTPSMADTCDITDISECLDRISIDFNTFKHLNSGHPAIPYNGH